MAIHRNLLGILVILALGVALVACTSASAAQNGNAGQADTGEISKLSSPPQATDAGKNNTAQASAAIPVETKDKRPQAAEQPKQEPVVKNKPFPTLEELAAMGVTPDPYRHRSRFRWGWDEEYEVNERYDIDTTARRSSVADRVVRAVLLVSVGTVYFEDERTWEIFRYAPDEETLEAARWLGEQLIVSYDLNEEQTELRKVYTARVEPDYSVKPQIVTKEHKKVFLFGSIVHITFEGERSRETVSLRVKTNSTDYTPHEIRIASQP